MDNCIFCKIIKGDIPSFTIYEDENVKVFLDINPVSDGDCLIIPKKHYVNIKDIDLDTLTNINEVSKKIYSLLKEKLHCKGITFSQNNDLGQEVKHYHLHATPVYQITGDERIVNDICKNDIENTFKKIIEK